MKMNGINDYMYNCKLKCTVKHSVKLWMHWFDSHFTAVKVPIHYSSVRVYQTSMSPVKIILKWIVEQVYYTIL